MSRNQAGYTPYTQRVEQAMQLSALRRNRQVNNSMVGPPHNVSLSVEMAPPYKLESPQLRPPE